MILFLDFVTNKAYDPKIMQQEPLGGTETTVTRVAEALSSLGHDVTVIQHCRKVDAKFGANYAGVEKLLDIKPKFVVILRNSKLVPFVVNQWPKAKTYLWCHDLASEQWMYDLPMIVDCGTELLTVSQWHKDHILNNIPSNAPMLEPLKMHVMYNPIEDRLAPDNTMRSPNKLLFFSSPHKGLEHALSLFACLKFKYPLLELFVTNPGYLKTPLTTQPGVVNIGATTRSVVEEHLRSSFCVFYPNVVHPETFGLVFAESNAVGTPVLTHNLGAAAEVLTDSKLQLVDCTNVKSVVDRFVAWKTYGKPDIVGKPEFRLTEVIKQWINLLKL